MKAFMTNALWMAVWVVVMPLVVVAFIGGGPAVARDFFLHALDLYRKRND